MYDQWCSADTDHLATVREGRLRQSQRPLLHCIFPVPQHCHCWLSAAQERRHPLLAADATSPKRASQRQLLCDGVLLYDSYESIILYAFLICHVTHSASWTTKQPDMTFYGLPNVFLQPEDCDAKGNIPNKRNEVKTNTKMTQQTSWSHFPPLWTQLTALI